VFSNPKGRAHWMTLAVCGAFYNPRKATCGTTYWVVCYGYTDPQVALTHFPWGWATRQRSMLISPTGTLQALRSCS
jgi:hypothetical protein